MLEMLKNLFRSKKKKLILDIKKKHKKNITDNDINDYRRKHKKYSNSDNDILMLILSEDIEIKSAHPRNTEVQTNNSDYCISSPVSSSSNSYKSSKSSRKDDDYYSSSNSSNYDSGSSYHSNSYCSGSSSSSSSSDCGSSSSCD